MATNRIGPPCPECGSQLTDVTRTVRTIDQGFMRYRLCPCCHHKFCTVQQPEQYLIDGTVQWVSNNQGKHRQTKINWTPYETR